MFFLLTVIIKPFRLTLNFRIYFIFSFDLDTLWSEKSNWRELNYTFFIRSDLIHGYCLPLAFIFLFSYPPFIHLSFLYSIYPFHLFLSSIRPFYLDCPKLFHFIFSYPPFIHFIFIYPLFIPFIFSYPPFIHFIFSYRPFIHFIFTYAPFIHFISSPSIIFLYSLLLFSILSFFTLLSPFIL